MFNDTQDDLLDLIYQECKRAVKEKRSAIAIEKRRNPDNKDRWIYRLFINVDGHDLWNVGLNEDHDSDGCVKCNEV